MLALEISSTKSFMSSLLTGEAFDIFLLEGATIRTAVTYSIDGRIHPEFYPPGERGQEYLPYAFRPWSEMKSLCYDLIKGKYTPLFFKFIFQLKPEYLPEILADGPVDPARVKALALCIRFDQNKVVLTTGISFHTFEMDRETERLWDRAVCSYLDAKKIGYEKL